MCLGAIGYRDSKLVRRRELTNSVTVISRTGGITSYSPFRVNLQTESRLVGEFFGYIKTSGDGYVIAHVWLVHLNALFSGNEVLRRVLGVCTGITFSKSEL
jgi:hypothetical protein